MMSFKYFHLGVIFSLISTSLFAVTLNLYDQPKKDAKIISTVDSEVGVIPIFTAKEGDWIKVGDPRNGNVGWISANDLKSSHTQNSNFSFRVITTGSGPNSYRIVQFGSPQQLPTEQAEVLLKKMEIKQQQIQKDMQKMMSDLFSQTEMTWPTIPIIVPVIVVPQKTPEKPGLKTNTAVPTQPSAIATPPVKQ